MEGGVSEDAELRRRVLAVLGVQKRVLEALVAAMREEE